MPADETIRFCRSRDGTRIAFATLGTGPPLLWVGHFARHLEHDHDSPVWRHWLATLSKSHTLIRYDLRGCGLSDREVTDFSIARQCEDFDAVVEAAAIGRFAFLGTAGNVAPGIRYAVRFPDRVSHLVLYACHTRGLDVRPRTKSDLEEANLRLDVFRLGWGKFRSPFGQFISAVHLPQAQKLYFDAFSQLASLATSPQNASSLIRSYRSLDLRADLATLRRPTLVIHCRQDPIVPFEEGRIAASIIKGGRLVPLSSGNHILQADEIAWKVFEEVVQGFLASDTGRLPIIDLSSLTKREREIAVLVQQGLANAEIAAALNANEKTIRNHVSAILGKLGMKTRLKVVASSRRTRI
jgi:pimeloyl-ACP methyl ester carboxylesterase/DNA-binding CsgD family transcriptional regulator